MELRGKTFLLTGASGGIGQAMAQALAAQGVRLLLVGRDAAKLDAVKRSLPLTGGSASPHLIVLADLATDSGRAALVQACQATGPLDGVINNAGVSQFALIEAQDFAAQLQTNLLAPMQLTQALLPQLLARPTAVIVNVGSAFGSIGHPGYSGYCASKFGLRGFTEALRRELADTAVAVLYLAPRATDTGINSPAVVEMNKALGNQTDSPQRVAAELIAQLKAGQARRYIGWPEQLFVRVNALLPHIVDKALAAKLAIVRRFATGNP